MRFADIRELAFFDARAFNIPANEVANYFLGRAKDWHRNSVSMFARWNLSPRELKGKRIPEIHEMLHDIGRNWSTDLTDEEKNGTFLVGSDVKSRSNIEPHYPQISSLWESVEPCEAPMKSRTRLHVTGNGRAENGNASALNTTPNGSRYGGPGSGT
jgi:hypothetical protein